MHLDLAADSKDEDPNTHIRDLKIKFLDQTTGPPGKKFRWTKVHETRLAKILARFQPRGAVSVQTGYFIQRSDGSLTLFALARFASPPAML